MQRYNWQGPHQLYSGLAPAVAEEKLNAVSEISCSLHNDRVFILYINVQYNKKPASLLISTAINELAFWLVLLVTDVFKPINGAAI